MSDWQDEQRRRHAAGALIYNMRLSEVSRLIKKTLKYKHLTEILNFLLAKTGAIDIIETYKAVANRISRPVRKI